MIELIKPGTDPWFNIAAEEYIAHNLEEEVFMLWQNTDCIVMGKHQNSLSEINHHWLEKAGIPAIRRISGGGTVFQGEGNINFSFITNHPINSMDKISFARATAPIISFLKTKGIDAKLTEISNISINGKKISGNAAHIHKHRSLHHGTLLFNANLDKIKQSINHDLSAYQTKAIPSNRVEIINLQTLLGTAYSLQDFEDELRHYIKKLKHIKYSRELREEEIHEIQEIADTKYRSWEWNFAYSPDYRFKRKLNLADKELEISLYVRRGHIKEIHFSNSDDLPATIAQSLINCPHRHEAIVKAILPVLEAKGFSRNTVFTFANDLI